MRLPFRTFWEVFPILSSSFISLGPTGRLFVVNKRINTDGTTRDAALIGLSPTMGTFPGPAIRGNKGDTFRIDVVNMLRNKDMLTETTIHWHGIHQDEGTNWADGAAFVTQCPILSGESFLYNFPVLNQAGTFWYHSHYANQYCDGLRGPLIVMDPDDPHKNLYDIDDDSTVITLADWYHQFATKGQSTWDSTLINGVGQWPNSTQPTKYAVVNVFHGKRYRFRLINMSCHAPYNFTIDKHDLQVIEVDGTSIVPVTVNEIQVFAGQRYSFVLDTNHDLETYWIRAPVANDPNKVGGLAILRYLPVPVWMPYSRPRTDNPLLETNLHPLPSEDPSSPGRPVLDGADISLDLEIGFDEGNFTVNGYSFRSPSVPVLTQILNGRVDPREILPVGSVYSLARNKTVQITIRVDDTVAKHGGPHPIHLHGHSFSVVRSAGNSTENYVNPVRRDTVATSVVGGGKDTTVIRFTTDNVGPWILQCHIDWHREKGLAIVLAEDIPGTPAAVVKRPDSWNDLCLKYWNSRN